MCFLDIQKHILLDNIIYVVDPTGMANVTYLTPATHGDIVEQSVTSRIKKEVQL